MTSFVICPDCHTVRSRTSPCLCTADTTPWWQRDKMLDAPGMAIIITFSVAIGVLIGMAL